MFTHYHDSANWSMLHETLKKMGREDLIGNSKKHLAPAFQLAIMGGLFVNRMAVHLNLPKPCLLRNMVAC